MLSHCSAATKHQCDVNAVLDETRQLPDASVSEMSPMFSNKETEGSKAWEIRNYQRDKSEDY